MKRREKMKKGEFLYWEKSKNTWVEWYAHCYMYTERGGYYTERGFTGYTKREMINLLRKDGISVPRYVGNC